MTQLNTPYPSTAYLTGFLRSRGFHAEQRDLALELVLTLMSSDGLEHIRAAVVADENHSPSVTGFLEEFDRYQTAVDRVIQFLQGRDSTLAHRINSRQFLPEGLRFAPLDEQSEDDDPDPLYWAFGALGVRDRARHLATLFLSDLVRYSASKRP